MRQSITPTEDQRRIGAELRHRIVSEPAHRRCGIIPFIATNDQNYRPDWPTMLRHEAFI